MNPADAYRKQIVRRSLAGTCLCCALLSSTLVAEGRHSDSVVWLVQRQKEILRNKKERRFQRDAHALKANPEAIKEELKGVRGCRWLPGHHRAQHCTEQQQANSCAAGVLTP